MNYALLKQLKNAGYKLITATAEDQQYGCEIFWIDSVGYLMPTLSELVEACGNDFAYLSNMMHKKLGWAARGDETEEVYGKSPEEAVACLWLALKQR